MVVLKGNFKREWVTWPKGSSKVIAAKLLGCWMDRGCPRGGSGVTKVYMGAYFFRCTTSTSFENTIIIPFFAVRLLLGEDL